MLFRSDVKVFHVPVFRASGEHKSVDSPLLSSGNLGLGNGRNLNIVGSDIGEMDIFHLELTTETGTVQTSTEKGGFVCVDVLSNMRPNFTSVICALACIERVKTYLPMALVTAA